MSILKGSCHCGGVTVRFETGVTPGDMDVLACQCSFCRMHGARAASDRNGSVCFAEQRPGILHHYRFGLKTADYLLCRNCGVYLGAIVSGDGDGPERAIVNIPILADQAAFTRTPSPAVYDDENIVDRLARRRRNWTPAKFEVPTT